MFENTIFYTGSGADIKRFDKRFIGQNFEKAEEGFFFTTNTMHEEILTLIKNSNKDSMVLELNNEIFAMVLNPRQIKFVLSN